jgi:hypothetical protein
VSAAIRRLAALVLAATVLASCGGSSGVPPARYVHAMCGALGNWKREVQQAGVQLQSSGAASSSRAAAKRDYQQFVASLVTATQRAAVALRSAGRPAVDGGGQIADGLANAFRGASRQLAHTSTQVGTISTASLSTFQLGASSVTTEIKTALQRIAAVKPSQNVALRTAAARDPACQVLRG